MDGGISVDQRKMNAVRAYFEWMPIRQVEMDDNLRIWRSFSIGNLLDLIMLDTRQYDRSITDLYWNTNYIHQVSSTHPVYEMYDLNVWCGLFTSFISFNCLMLEILTRNWGA